MKPCCEDAENRELVEAESREDVTVTRCKVCGCRHYEVEADFGSIGVAGARL